MRILKTTWLIPLLSGLQWGSCYGPWERYRGPINERAAIDGFAISMILLLMIRQLAHAITEAEKNKKESGR